MFALVGYLVLSVAAGDDVVLQVAAAKPKQQRSAEPEPTIGFEVIQLIEDGWTRIYTGKAAEALDLLNKAVEMAPKNAAALSGLGWALLKTDDPDSAEKYFRRAIVVDPGNKSALHGMGEINYLRHNYTAAEAYLRKVPPVDPAAWLTLAKINLLQGHYEEAAKWTQKVRAWGNEDDLVGHILAASIVGELDDELRAQIEPPKRKKTAAANPPAKATAKPRGKSAQ